MYYGCACYNATINMAANTCPSNKRQQSHVTRHASPSLCEANPTSATNFTGTSLEMIVPCTVTGGVRPVACNMMDCRVSLLGATQLASHVTHRTSRIARHASHVTHRTSRIARRASHHTSLIARHASHHTSLIARQASHDTCHASPVTLQA